jgi:hypothetical protein
VASPRPPRGLWGPSPVPRPPLPAPGAWALEAPLPPEPRHPGLDDGAAGVLGEKPLQEGLPGLQVLPQALRLQGAFLGGEEEGLRLPVLPLLQESEGLG